MCVPDSIKRPVYPKSLLVESLKPLLPDEIVHRPKQGFLFPWNTWMKNELRSFCEKHINNMAGRSFCQWPEPAAVLEGLPRRGRRYPLGRDLAVCRIGSLDGKKRRVMIRSLLPGLLIGLLCLSAFPGNAQGREEFDGPFDTWADVRKRFHVHGDGITDDTKALQRAIDSLTCGGVPDLIWAAGDTPSFTSPREPIASRRRSASRGRSA